MIPKHYQQYESTVTLGCVNYQSIWNDKAASIGKVKKLIGEAAGQGINILVFPELSLSGYESDEGNTMHREFAETIPGPATEEIAQLTRKLDIYVVLGMPERDPDDADTCYISCPLLGPEGFIGNYRKLHLGTPPLFRESLCFTGGNRVPVFETRYGPIGIQICADFWVFPELSRILMLKGARIIINSTASMNMPGRPFYITSMTAARATENMVYTASANLVGKERTLSYYGHSTIAGPAFPRFSHIYAQAEDKEEIISATLSFARLHRFREAVSLEKLRRSDVIMNEFNHLDTCRN
ncbi:MAG: carbon-nitrogen hydrolase family protein [Gammaproteobacteria bacterium]|nr:carbon-nitrogen hydrolase family protein [Gammaproteobacteria bacterium]MDE0286389.1 carbon-nitrogen hydrolase family protein [Gammaproteobacteria bacterium]MDE0514190.1 carbon-nitrogen hydrolase family protein [Gammaproteobacteria bacterium]